LKGDDIYLPAAPPPETAKPAAQRGRELALARSRVLARPLRLLAIRPRGVPEHGAFEAAAIRPHGSVERLLWIRDFRANWNRVYWLRDPLPLPSGTPIAVYSLPAASAVLTAGGTGQDLPTGR
jgi:hypothetical protein